MPPLSEKQFEFIENSNARWNLAHGAVRTGKTVCTLFAFMADVDRCPDSKIFIVGHTFDTAYRNVIRLFMESTELLCFRPFLTWSGKKLYYKDKEIIVLGAKDEGSVGNFQGDTYSLVYCDEMTLFPQSIIEMINSRLSKPWSKGYATMNPKHPGHILKTWIDKAEEGDPNYYALHFRLEDNPFVDDNYKESLKSSSTGIFYKRNYLGLWCLAEGAVFDFFDKSFHVVRRPPAAADYWIAGIDYGSRNAFCCLLIGVSTGMYSQTGKQMWVEKEYYWDPVKRGRQKVNSEFADDVQQFISEYAVRVVYLDPSAEAFQLELKRRGIHAIHANNDVYNGIQSLSNDLRNGKVLICDECVNTIREIEGYVWDIKSSERGDDAPVKKNDHAVDALRYCIASHKIALPESYTHNPMKYQKDRFGRPSNF